MSQKIITKNTIGAFRLLFLYYEFDLMMLHESLVITARRL